MGQSPVRAALIYQHSTLKRQREIARDIDALVCAEREKEAQAQKKQEPRETGGESVTA